MTPDLPALIDFYEHLSPADIERFGDFYAADAWFKDPFNEVRGLPAIQRIFRHMFGQVAEPRFRVLGDFSGADGIMLRWEFSFRSGRPERPGKAGLIRGTSHLRFAEDGRVSYHRDYWDTAEELYFSVPGLGLLLRGLRRALAA